MTLRSEVYIHLLNDYRAAVVAGEKFFAMLRVFHWQGMNWKWRGGTN